jgi:hypothetical protein
MAPALFQWDHSLMDDDDPEKRIRELERGLADQYPVADSGYQQPKVETSWTPPPPGVPTPAMPFGTGPGGPAPGLYGGGLGSVLGRGRSPAFRFVWILAAFWVLVIPIGMGFSWFMSNRTASWNPFSSGSTSVPQGGSLSLGGNNTTQTVACNDGSLTLGGNNGNFTVTGHCLSLMVSGNNTRVTVERADTIDAGGINTMTTYHSGEPKITKSGINVVVQSG